MDAVTELAKLFKARENPSFMGMVTGMVLTPPPNIKIAIGKEIILEKEHLIIAAALLNNTLVNRDEVILMPSQDQQTYYLIDKAVRL